jgi:RNA polymerase sigma-70 factor, ECF subfamily
MSTVVLMLRAYHIYGESGNHTLQERGIGGYIFWTQFTLLSVSEYVGEEAGQVRAAEAEECEALAGLARAEPAAFARIIREHQAMVYSVAFHMLGDASLAEDVAQEVFLQLYQRRTSIQSSDHLRFWLRKVACHRALDCVRRRGAQALLPLDEVPEPRVAAVASDPWLQNRLWRLVASLPAKMRMALILRYQEDLAYDEIADLMDIPVNSVKSSMDRALKMLREKLARAAEGVGR